MIIWPDSFRVVLSRAVVNLGASNMGMSITADARSAREHLQQQEA